MKDVVAEVKAGDVAAGNPGVPDANGARSTGRGRREKDRVVVNLGRSCPAPNLYGRVGIPAAVVLRDVVAEGVAEMGVVRRGMGDHEAGAIVVVRVVVFDDRH